LQSDCHCGVQQAVTNSYNMINLHGTKEKRINVPVINELVHHHNANIICQVTA